MKEQKNHFLKAGKLAAVFAVMIVAAISGMLYLSQIGEVVVEQTIREREIRLIPLGDGEPSGDECFMKYFMAYPHQADPATAYASNLSNATAYEYRDYLSGEMTGETPYNTAFDFVFAIGINDTVGYNITSSLWMPSWIYPNITVDFDFASDISETQMTMVEIANNSNWAWYNCYVNNAGAGYQITHNEKYNVTSIKCSGYW